MLVHRRLPLKCPRILLQHASPRLSRSSISRDQHPCLLVALRPQPRHIDFLHTIDAVTDILQTSPKSRRVEMSSTRWGVDVLGTTWKHTAARHRACPVFSGQACGPLVSPEWRAAFFGSSLRVQLLAGGGSVLTLCSRTSMRNRGIVLNHSAAPSTALWMKRRLPIELCSWKRDS